MSDVYGCHTNGCDNALPFNASSMYCEECHECPECGGPVDDPPGICLGCANKQSREIMDTSPVEQGDLVEYEGDTWVVDIDAPQHMVHLRPAVIVNEEVFVMQHVTVEDAEQGVDIRDVDLVRGDAGE